MADQFAWIEELPAAVTVTDAEGTIIAMNARSCANFAEDGGAALIGQSVFACHPEPAKSKTLALFKDRQANHYSISKGGRTKMIHQLPWYRDGQFAGFVELSIVIPDVLAHFDRD